MSVVNASRPTAGVLLALVASCSSQTSTPPQSTSGLVWPAGDPRVGLVEVIDGPGGSSKKTWTEWLTGAQTERRFLQRPFAVAWDGEDLLVSDAGLRRVVRVARSGKVIRHTPEDALISPVGLAVCGAGIAVSDSVKGSVELFDSQLRPVRTLITDLIRPTGLACRGSQLWIAETGRHQVVRISLATAPESADRPASPFTTFIGMRGDGPGQFNFPTALTLQGPHLWVADTLNFRLQEVNADSGDPVSEFGALGDAAGEMPRLKGLTVDSSGLLWISDAILDQIALFATDGTLLLSLGGRGDLPGQFAFPAGLAAHQDGRVAVVDSFNRRVQIFQVITRDDPLFEIPTADSELVPDR